MARRDPCPDFDEIYKSLFDQVQADLQSGLRHTRRFASEHLTDVNDSFLFLHDAGKDTPAWIGAREGAVSSRHGMGPKWPLRRRPATGRGQNGC